MSVTPVAGRPLESEMECRPGDRAVGDLFGVNRWVVANLVVDYEQGSSMREVAARYGVRLDVVQKILIRLNVVRSNRSRATSRSGG